MPQKHNILVIHGPNLNLLGSREKAIYGATTLTDIDKKLKALAKERGVTLSSFQSNHEGAIIDHLHAHQKSATGILINPGALAHTSIALRDALLGIAKPAVEVHLSNIQAREEFRKHSYISDIVIGIVSGFGALSYELGFNALATHLEKI